MTGLELFHFKEHGHSPSPEVNQKFIFELLGGKCNKTKISESKHHTDYTAVQDEPLYQFLIEIIFKVIEIAKTKKVEMIRVINYS